MNSVESRRRFLSRLSIGLTALAAAVVSVPILSYLLSPLIEPTPNAWRDVGPVDGFGIGETVEVAFDDPSPLPWAGQTARTAAWVRRTGPQTFIAFAVNCTHLGCPVSWQAQAEIFLCPCHGGVFYSDGRVASGPPPRELFRYETRINNGRLELLSRGLQVS
jgi:menaquinol-cytochrome c reductase iron-sulfur subunit